jgi:adenylosuccinate synthase
MGNRKIILVLSGEICAGKTTLANQLVEKFNFKTCKTRDGVQYFASKKFKGVTPDRVTLQKFGEQLDKKTEGKWVLDYFQHLFSSEFNEHSFFLIDSVRIFNQIKKLRSAYSYVVYHIHLRAQSESLEERFYKRNEFSDIANSKERYKLLKQDTTEAKVNELENEADLIIDTDRCNAQDVLVRVASFLNLLSTTHRSLVDVIVGGQFGSEGKGQIAAHIAPEYDCLMRVGGPNAGHSVFELPDKHVFHLLPSGTIRNPNAKLLIGPGAVLNLKKILEEIKHFGVEDANRLVIDENAIIITDDDIKFEQKVKDQISSTGQGVGHATANNILARLNGVDAHKAKNYTSYLKQYIGSTYDELEKLYRDDKKVLLEGTQGTALSLHHGLYPHVTSRDTCVSGCLSEAGISPMRVRKIIMVTRTYPIRVGGASGPLVSNEINWDIVADRSGKSPEELKRTEKTTTTKKDRRVAEFSWTMFRKACELNSPTDIALTFTDYISAQNEKARRYDQLTRETRQLIEEIERCSGVKASLIGTCFDYRAIIDRRNWR